MAPDKRGSSKKTKPIIGISIGDINGIGPEVIIKALQDNRMLNLFTPIIYGSAKVLSFYKKGLRSDDFQYTQTKSVTQLHPNKVYVVNCWQDAANIQVGVATEEGGKYALLALERAVSDLKEGLIDGLVTAPINKKNIQQEGFNFPGHTEYITERLDAKESLMMMVEDALRVGVATAHIPLEEVSGMITEELLRSKLQILEKTLKRDFGILKPKIAVLGLNPHAGEAGLLGSQEDDIITPLVQSMRDSKRLVFGPFPADGFFGTREYTKFDAVLAMYHDQGLVPFKTIAFDTGVNYTAGLPAVRTSPDHGTAYGIAGKGVADETSMRSALFACYDIIRNRKEYQLPQEL